MRPDTFRCKVPGWEKCAINNIIMRKTNISSRLTGYVMILFALTISSCAVSGYTRGGSSDKDQAKNVSQITSQSKTSFKNYFTGNIEIRGIVEDKSGIITQTFTGKMRASWEENRAVLQEAITYSDGKKGGRTWLITLEPSGDFGIVVHDLVGPASGNTSGAATVMSYGIKEGEGKSEKVEKFRKVIYIIDDSSAISTSIASSGLRHVAFYRRLD